MDYYDDREIRTISCDISILYQIYTNIRHELYTIIDGLKSINEDFNNKSQCLFLLADLFTIISKNIKYS